VLIIISYDNIKAKITDAIEKKNPDRTVRMTDRQTDRPPSHSDRKQKKASDSGMAPSFSQLKSRRNCARKYYDEIPNIKLQKLLLDIIYMPIHSVYMQKCNLNINSVIKEAKKPKV